MSAVCIPKVHHFYLTLLTLENMHIFLYYNILYKTHLYCSPSIPVALRYTHPTPTRTQTIHFNLAIKLLNYLKKNTRNYYFNCTSGTETTFN